MILCPVEYGTRFVLDRPMPVCTPMECIWTPSVCRIEWSETLVRRAIVMQDT